MGNVPKILTPGSVGASRNAPQYYSHTKSPFPQFFEKRKRWQISFYAWLPLDWITKAGFIREGQHERKVAPPAQVFVATGKNVA